MTDEELAAIHERWDWILLDALPSGSQAKADVRALYDEVERRSNLVLALRENRQQLLEIARAVAETPLWHAESTSLTSVRPGVRYQTTIYSSTNIVELARALLPPEDA